MTSSEVNSLVFLFQAQSLVCQLETAFSWDKKNPWVSRSKDGRFGSRDSNPEAKNNRFTSSSREVGHSTIGQDIGKKLDKAIDDINYLLADESFQNKAKQAIAFTASLVGISIAAHFGFKNKEQISKILRKAEKVLAKEGSSSPVPPLKDKEVRVPTLPNGVKETVEVDGRLRWTDFDFSVNEVPVQLSTLDQEILGKTVKDVMFDVNKSMNMQDLPAQAKARVAVKLKKTFDYISHDAKDGTIFRCAAWGKDGENTYRVEAYKRFGFSEPQGESKVMLGIIKQGKLEPFYPPFIDMLSKFSA